MGLRTGVLLIVMVLIAALATLNWGVLAAPVAMSLGFMHITAPLGLVMLALTGLLVVVSATYVVYLQSSMLLETRRQSKEIQAQRTLADKAEASRFTELRNFLEGQENTHMERNAERHAALLARVEQVEASIKLRSELLERAISSRPEPLKT
ncbi:LapA family protein [Variovorax sp. J2P1-59]|uniref:LapA family protein n=1 Tax=Variovorax flavidus TaxID=3053501 RepID=UPI002577EB87|nr:LapA family protein [Variovorax sp. J2P1-59]MDM0074993.1 LapA family protein [Variovorax sp. J2P1-59]